MVMAATRLKGRSTLAVDGFLEELEKEDLKKKTDLVALFEEFGVKLEKKGSSFMGLCPWHDDKNPSLSVDKTKGVYHCFGCGESGDAIELVKKMKGLGFREAVAYLKGEHTPPPRIHNERRIGESTAASPFLLDTIAEHYEKALGDARNRALKLGDEMRNKVQAESNDKNEVAAKQLAADTLKAEAGIAEMRAGVMATLGTIARDTAAEIVQKLTGESAAAGDLDAAINSALKRN